MEFNKAVSNPMLVGCIELVKAEDTPEHRNMFMTELTKAQLQAPALIEPAPGADGEGRLTLSPGSRVQFPMLSSPEGKKFFMGFTDPKAYLKWTEGNGEMPFFALKFEDYLNMLLSRDAQGNECQASGIVINPMGANVMVPKDMLARVVAARMEQLKHMAEKKP